MLADFIHPKVCKPICAKLLTLPSEKNLRGFLYVASLYGEEFFHWCEQNLVMPAMVPRLLERQPIPKYAEGRNLDGSEVLDASKYGVENIAQAVHLFASRSGLMKE